MDIVINEEISPAIICSDSRSVLSACINFNHLETNNFFIYKIRNLLSYAASINLEISLIWIPGHKGIFGNEVADKLAKMALKDGTLLDYRIPHTDFYKPISDEFVRKSNEDLRRDREHRRVGLYYFKNFYSNDLKPWFLESNLKKRSDIVNISRLRSNHYALADSLSRKGFVESEECSCGDLAENINHVLWACPRFEAQRKDLVKSLIKIKKFPPFCVESFLYEPNSPSCYLIIKFLRNAELLV